MWPFLSQEGAEEGKRTDETVTHRHTGRCAVAIGGRGGGVRRGGVEGTRAGARGRICRGRGRHSPACERHINPPILRARSTRGTHRVPEPAVAETEVEKVLDEEVTMSN